MEKKDKDKFIRTEKIKSLLDKRVLWDYILDELNKKHVGDISAKEIIFLSAIGRLVKNKKPYSYNCIIHSKSSAGKDHLVESVLRLFPGEDIEAFGRISKTALTYLHDSKLEPLFTYDGKVLYLEEITEEILNNEIMKVFTAGLSKSAITKDQKAEIIDVNGKPVIICTTSTTKPTPEILNRFSIVKLDEGEEQTKRIFLHEEEEYDEGIIEFLSKLKPLKVNIKDNMRKKIAGAFPCKKTSMRRLFERFLDIVRAVAIFHQGNIRGDEINVEWEDYDLAIRIFSNYRSGVSSIPLKREDQKILEVLSKSNEPLSIKEITSKMVGYLTIQSIYKHIYNLENNDILVSYDLRDSFGNATKKYQISEEMKDKNPIKLPPSCKLK